MLKVPNSLVIFKKNKGFVSLFYVMALRDVDYFCIFFVLIDLKPGQYGQ